MSLDPVLILQMQRMGDLVLSFPLLLWLERTMPGRPIWVVAEERFFTPLLPLSPKTFYIPWTRADSLRKRSFELILNLSHRPEAAKLAGELRAARRLGPALLDGASYIGGDVALYRASLTHNNRHNRFHWADMNALDVAPLATMAKTAWQTPRAPGDNGRVGLFLGASEKAKRPPAAFWAELAVLLQKRGLKPALLGGPAEVELGKRVAQLAGVKILNLCGRFDLKEFSAVTQTLGLLVTPDTGPMHLSVWSGLMTLNLSMGPVNPWETGPYNPGHYVLQSTLSCAGCWGCGRPGPPCRQTFDPKRVALVVAELTRQGGERLARLRLPGLRLLRSGRDRRGLYDLVPLRPSAAGWAREPLGAFWKTFFGHGFGLWPLERIDESAAELAASRPELVPRLARAATAFGRLIALSGREPGSVLAPDLWRQAPPALRPFTGFAHLRLQNEDLRPEARARVLGDLERLAGLLARYS